MFFLRNASKCSFIRRSFGLLHHFVLFVPENLPRVLFEERYGHCLHGTAYVCALEHILKSLIQIFIVFTIV